MMFQSFNPYKTFHEKQFFSLQFLRIRFIVYKEVLAAAPLFVTEWYVRGVLLRVFRRIVFAPDFMDGMDRRR